MWTIAIQQRNTQNGPVDCVVKTVFRPLINKTNSDEIERFIPVCRQMILENGNERHTIKYFKGQTKEIINYLGQEQTVNTGGFVYDYGTVVRYNQRPEWIGGKYYPKGTYVVKKEEVKESRMAPSTFAHFLIEKFGESLAGEIIGAFVSQ